MSVNLIASFIQFNCSSTGVWIFFFALPCVCRRWSAVPWLLFGTGFGANTEVAEDYPQIKTGRVPPASNLHPPPFSWVTLALQGDRIWAPLIYSFLASPALLIFFDCSSLIESNFQPWLLVVVFAPPPKSRTRVALLVSLCTFMFCSRHACHHPQ